MTTTFEELHFEELQQMFLEAREVFDEDRDPGDDDADIDEAVLCAVMQEVCCRFLDRISDPHERSKTALFVAARILAEADHTADTASAFATKAIHVAFEAKQ